MAEVIPIRMVYALVFMVFGTLYLLFTLRSWKMGKYYPQRMSPFAERHFKRTGRLHVSKDKDGKIYYRCIYTQIVVFVFFYIIGILILIW